MTYLEEDSATLAPRDATLATALELDALSRDLLRGDETRRVLTRAAIESTPRGVAEREGGAAAPLLSSRFSVLRTLGRGGMGRVLLARDLLLNRLTAIKVGLFPTGARGGWPARVRMMREAQALARINHGSIVSVYDVSIERGRVAIAMEFVRGEPLDRWFARLPPSRCAWPRKLAVLLRIARAIAAVHDLGLVHRDIKPSNVLVCPDDSVKLIDFGLARETGCRSRDPGGALGAVAVAEDYLSLSVTRDAGVIGTPRFAAPEQLLGASCEPRADQFSFCISALSLLLVPDALPRGGSEDRSLAIETLRPRAELRAHAFPDAAWELFKRGVEREPSRRHRDMSSLASALTTLTRAHADRSERRSLTRIYS